MTGPLDYQLCGNCHHSFGEHQIGDQTHILSQKEMNEIRAKFSTLDEQTEAIETERDKRRMYPCTKCSCGWYC